MHFTNSLVAFYWEDHGDVVLLQCTTLHVCCDNYEFN